MALLRTVFPLLALALSACSREAPPPAPPPKVMVQTVSAGGAVDAALAGEIRARHEFDLAFRVGGKLIARPVDVGTVVQPGDVLARLDPADLALAAGAAQAQWRAAEIDAQVAETERRRQADLLAKGFISPAAYDNRVNVTTAARERLNQAQAQAALSSNQASYGQLSSMVPAVVTAVLADAGQVVSAGAPVLRLARLGEFEVAVAVPESRLAEFQAAKTFSVQLWALPDLPLTATLRELSPAGDPASRTFAARLKISGAPPTLRLGMTATVQWLGGSASPTVLPSTALVDRGDGPQVWVLDGDKVQLRSVRVGRLGDQGVVIAEGLQAGDRVVVLGTDKLVPGLLVRAETKRLPAEQH